MQGGQAGGRPVGALLLLRKASPVLLPSPDAAWEHGALRSSPTPWSLLVSYCSTPTRPCFPRRQELTWAPRGSLKKTLPGCEALAHSPIAQTSPHPAQPQEVDLGRSVQVQQHFIAEAERLHQVHSGGGPGLPEGRAGGQSILAQQVHRRLAVRPQPTRCGCPSLPAVAACTHHFAVWSGAVGASGDPDL